jgi:PAS domain S-box-containing protein
VSAVERPYVEALEEALRAYRQHFELAPAAHVVTDAKGRVLQLNPSAVRLFNGSRPRMITSVVPPPARASLRAILRRLETRETGEETTALPLTPTGGRAQRALVTVRADPDVPDRLWWSLLDDTVTGQGTVEVRQLQEELEGSVREDGDESRRSRTLHELKQLESLLDHLPVAVFAVDASTWTVTVANEQARTMFEDATGSRELADITSFELLAADGTPLQTRPSLLAIERGERTDGERYAYRRRDGSLAVLEVSATPLREPDGRVAAAVVVTHDVSERERRERAEREFLSNAAHQLRTPVAAIQAAAEALLTGAKDEPSARERFIGHIAGSGARLAQLTQSLLVLARAQSGQELRLELLELEPLLRSVASGMRTHEGVETRVECRPEVVALANPEMLREVLETLADNAARHTRTGSITLRALRRGRSRVVLQVADTGPGISPEIRERMFERFYSGDSARGFGLGLAIAAQAAAAMQSHLEVESSPEHGTVAGLTLIAGRILS